MGRISESRVTRHLKCAYFLVLGILLCAVLSLARTPVSAGLERLVLNADYAVFRGDSGRAFAEVYYSFGSGQLRYLKEGANFNSAAVLDLSVLQNQTKAVVVHRRWKVPYSVSDTSLLGQNRSLVGLVGVLLKPAQYTLRIAAFDANDAANRDSLQLPLVLRSFSEDSLSESDIEVCSSIKQVSPDTSNMFYKNTLEVIPNPTSLFGGNFPIVYYYVELYNLLKKVKHGEYTYVASVYDAAGHEVITHRKRKRRAHDSSVEVGTINIGKLRSGTYTLHFAVDDSIAQEHTLSRKKFFVYNPGVSLASASGGGDSKSDYLSSEYALMDEKTIDKEFEVVRYVALEDEMKRYESLIGLDAKRKFMYEFWKRRDPDPTTLENEVKKEYLRRVEHANLNFRGGLKEGWKTDRGRVYIVYGPPDEIERHPNEMGSKSYEIWYYHSLQGGVEFDFIDRSGFSDYLLVNSTHRNEIRDDNWQQQLQTQ
jgi:GWxTD domain-containing protein